jgi:endoglucanase
MKKILYFLFCFYIIGFHFFTLAAQTVVRYNQLGYPPHGIKVVVAGSKNSQFRLHQYEVKNISSGRTVLRVNKAAEKDFGAYGPFLHSYRINLTGIQKPGDYQLIINDSIRSGIIHIAHDVYKGSADFCLRYMRQQRSGFNPFLNDSCHQYDGYTLYGPMPDSTHIDVSGGWHDASDYLQYVTTSANATWHLLAAYRDFPSLFNDDYQANGLKGGNGQPDVLDEARWGLDWLVKMHPAKDMMFHQLADDRDHSGMRLPGLDSQYAKGYERPVYFVTGQPQGSEKYKNRSNGVANIAGKFSSAFALGSRILRQYDGSYAEKLQERAVNAYQFGLAKPGVCQTAPHKAAYFYEEENWTDDMELAASELYQLKSDKKYLDDALNYAVKEETTPWMGTDTAKHYQWYPFVNAGHFQLAQLRKNGQQSNPTYAYMRSGLEKVWVKAKTNAFYRGIPFIWCSNNFTVSFAMQCHWYENIAGDSTYSELGQANFDWLFGCNPWGTSMVYGLPANGDFPSDPHSSFSYLKKYPLDGALVDGPVKTSIFNSLLGVELHGPDKYAEWQSGLAVYHDDYGDYSTNEPTMDGTASLVYLLASKENDALGKAPHGAQQFEGAIIRGDSSKKKIAMVFTGHEFADGGKAIQQILAKEKVKASFFFTGEFIKKYPALVKQLRAGGHYIGPHSNEHLLYNDWKNRDSLFVTKAEFNADLLANYHALKPMGITQKNAPVFMPPYEWYNEEIAYWTDELGVTLINNTPGTLSTADYTTPDMPNYVNSDSIFQSIVTKSRQMPYGLNGYFLTMHIGSASERKDKFYYLLPLLVQELKNAGYSMIRVDEMLGMKAEAIPKEIQKKKPVKKVVKKSRKGKRR